MADPDDFEKLIEAATPGPAHYWSYTDVDGDPRFDGRAYTIHCLSFKPPKDEYDGIELGNDDEALATAKLTAALHNHAEDFLALWRACRRLRKARSGTLIAEQADEADAAEEDIRQALDALDKTHG